MSLSFLDAYIKLGTAGYQSVESLVSLLKSVAGEVAGAPPGSTYLLYSGAVADGTFVKAFAGRIANESGALDLTKSEIGILANNARFQAELGFAIRNEVLQGAPLSSMTGEQRIEVESRFQEILNGKDINGNRIKSSSANC